MSKENKEVEAKVEEGVGKEDSNSDYMKYRGKCREMSEALVAENPSLRLVRGYYYCPIWGRQEHWWTEKPDGTVVDPTAKQFPSKGIGEYEEFDGLLYCENCGMKVTEEQAHIDGHHVFCSDACYGLTVM